MKSLFQVLAVIGIAIFASVDLIAEDCIDCARLHGITPAISFPDLSQGIACPVEKKTSGDFDFDIEEEEPHGASSDDSERCLCLVTKQSELLEGKTEYESSKKLALGKLMQTRFISYSRDLEKISDSLLMSGHPKEKMNLLGEKCSIRNQLMGITCGTEEERLKRIQEIFGVEGANYGETLDKLARDTFLKFGSTILGRLPGEAPTLDNCLYAREIDNIKMNDFMQEGSSETMLKEAFTTMQDLFHKRWEQYIELKRNYKDLSPYELLRKMLESGGEYQDLRMIFTLLEKHPKMMAIFSGHESFAQLKKYMANKTVGVEEVPSKMLSEILSTEGGFSSDSIYANMEQSCNRFKENLTQLLCQDVVPSGEMENKSFERHFMGENVLHEVYACQERLCASKKITSNCSTKKMGLPIDRMIDALSVQISPALMNVPEKVVVGLKSDGEQLQKKLCSKLLCPDVKSAVDANSCSPLRSPMRRAQDLFNELGCPAGDPFCNDSDLFSLLAYQGARETLGIDNYVEVSDSDNPNAPKRRVLKEEAPFSQTFWDIPKTEGGVEVIGVVEELSSRPKEVGSSAAGVSAEKNAKKQATAASQKGNSASATINPTTRGGNVLHRPEIIQGMESIERQIKSLDERMATSKDREQVERFRQEKAKLQDAYQQLKRQRDIGKEVTREVFEGQETAHTYEQKRNYRMNNGDTVSRYNGNPVKESASAVAPVGTVAGGASASVDDSVATAGKSATGNNEREKGKRSPASEVGPEEQILKMSKEDLWKLEDKYLENQGLDLTNPFVVQIKDDAKIYEIRVMPILIEGKTVYQPEELQQIESENRPLYRVLLKTPLFKSYFDYQNAQSVSTKELGRLMESV